MERSSRRKVFWWFWVQYGCKYRGNNGRNRQKRRFSLEIMEIMDVMAPCGHNGNTPAWLRVSCSANWASGPELGKAGRLYLFRGQMSRNLQHLRGNAQEIDLTSGVWQFGYLTDWQNSDLLVGWIGFLPRIDHPEMFQSKFRERCVHWFSDLGGLIEFDLNSIILAIFSEK